MKGKHWGSLTASVEPGYRTNVHGSHGGSPSGKMVAVSRTKEYATNVVGSHGGTPSGKFLGQTKDKIRHGSKLSANRTSGVSTGHGGGQHKAGG